MEEQNKTISAANEPQQTAPASTNAAPAGQAPGFPAYPYGTVSPIPQEPFVSNRRELIAALLSYVIGWLYVKAVLEHIYEDPLLMMMFAASFTAAGLLYFRDRLHKAEHWIWLGCMWLCLLCEFIFPRNHVWGGSSILFVHAFAIYWLLTLSGKLMEGKSGMFLPVDAFNGVILLPFARFFTFFRTRVLFWGVRQLRGKKKFNTTAFIYGLIAIAVAAVLLVSAGNLLSDADNNFGTFLDSLLPEVDGEFLSELLVTLLVSLPVGAYLYGLAAGADRLTAEELEGKKNGIRAALGRIRQVPNLLWVVLTYIFVAFYAVFLGFQGSYFFGAFTRSLPESFTVAEYARQGFFELCKLLTLNFALLWLVCFSSAKPVTESRSGKLACSCLLAESMLFAVTALSKLILYIDCFGFTPKRLQSFWLMCVLLFGCICCLVSLLSRKNTARIWICFTGISLALLHLV